MPLQSSSPIGEADNSREDCYGHRVMELALRKGGLRPRALFNNTSQRNFPFKSKDAGACLVGGGQEHAVGSFAADDSGF